MRAAAHRQPHTWWQHTSEACRGLRRMNWLLLAVVGCLCSIGIAFIFAIGRQHGGGFELVWQNQAMWVVIGLGGMLGLLSRWRKDFEADRNTRPASFYRKMNEIPTVLMIVIVIMAIVRPF